MPMFEVRDAGKGNLPAVRDDPAVVDDVVAGVVVDDTPDRPRRPPVVVRAVLVIVRHEHARRAGRHAAYIPLGAWVTAKWVWESRSTARFERHIRVAEATGDQQSAREWEVLRQKWVEGKHTRRMERAESMRETFVKLPFIAGGFVGVLAMIGVFLAIADKHITAFADPFRVVATIVQWTAIALSVSYGPFLLAAPWLTLVVLWHVGRRAASSAGAPRWLRIAADDQDVQIDERAVTQALEALRIPQIRDYLKTGAPLPYLVPCRQEGRGTYCEIRLPKGLPASEIARPARRERLAAGLYRHAKEVWPSPGDDASHLRLWIADKGALAEGAGPYPLLDDGFTDVFRGVPFGRTLRGDPVTAPLMERNTIIGGIPGQGKSSAARTILCGVTLDITTEVRVCIPDTNFDFEAIRPRCSVYVMGAETEHVEEIRTELARLKAEVQERGELLVQYQVPEVTRELASAGVGLHPLFFLLEEAHVAITHPEYGRDISGFLTDIVRLGRKRGIHVIVSTQAPTKDSIPRDVTRNCSNGIAYAVSDHVANDALLGQGAYRGGHRATELIPGTDRGIAVVKGFTGERSDMIQSYFVDVAQVPAIVQRALGEMTRRGREIPGTGRARVIEVRDLLDDLAEVLRDAPGRVRLADVPPLLRTLAPGWAPYRRLTGTELRTRLERETVRVLTTGGILWLDPSDLRAVIARREAE